MSIKDKLNYLNFFIQRLQVETKPEDAPNDGSTITSLAFADPKIVTEKEEKIAVFPFKFELRSIDIVISTEFLIGFEIISSENTNEESLRELASNNEEFTRYVNKVLDKIVDNALENTNIRFNDQVSFNSIVYPPKY
ncbi:MAG: hypothetical protein Q4A60_06355 [Pasteurellaceae bacterium]|nr:hypothetical protein [Pasteurellaceae bacterium]